MRGQLPIGSVLAGYRIIERELRDWLLRALFQRFPGLRFEVTDVVVGPL